MSHSLEQSRTFVPLRSAAFRLGVSIAWLRREAIEGRLPCLKTGRRLMVRVEDVEKALVERAIQGANETEGRAEAVSHA